MNHYFEMKLWEWGYNTKREKLIMSLIWKLPMNVIYWCAIRAVAYGTTNQYGDTDPGKLDCLTMLKRIRS